MNPSVAARISSLHPIQTMNKSHKPVSINQLYSIIEDHESNEALDDNKDIIAFVREWYGPKAREILLTYESVYNDETNDGRPCIETVRDKDGVELPILSDTGDNCEAYIDAWYDVQSNHEVSNVGDDYGESKTIWTEEVKLPTLYTKG